MMPACRKRETNPAANSNAMHPTAQVTPGFLKTFAAFPSEHQQIFHPERPLSPRCLVDFARAANGSSPPRLPEVNKRPKPDLDPNATRCIAALRKQAYILCSGAANLSKVFDTLKMNWVK